MQHDFSLDNQPGAAFRGDLNEALQALVGQSSGDTAPSVTYAFMWWMDTTNSLLKQRNAGNTAWMTQAAIVGGQLVPYAGGQSADERYARLVGANDFDTVPTVNGTPLAVGGSAVWTTMPVGMPFPLYDHIAGVAIPPTDDPNFRYVKLSAGANGAGQYNYGVLEAESVSSGSPFPTATSLVNLPGSPFDGYTINLINTEGRYIKPGTASGALADDQMQGHCHGLNTSGFGAASGSQQPGTSALRNPTEGSSGDSVTGEVVGDGVNGAPRIGDHTDVRHVQSTFYVRIL